MADPLTRPEGHSLMSPHLKVMERAAERAARGLLHDFGEVEQLQVSRKGPRDFVSAADTRAEETILGILRKSRPGYAVLSEECGEIPGSEPYRWVVDPLDGTSNFLHSIPHFCISIGLEQHTAKGTQLIAGLILQPLTRDIFWAEKGKGAFHNGRRLKVSARKDVMEAILATGNSAFRSGNPTYDRLTHHVSHGVGGIRCMGSAALDLAFVASGKFDGFWQIGLKQWDMAAGLLMIKEAGGTVRELHMQGDPYETGNILATTSHLSPKLDKLMAEGLRA